MVARSVSMGRVERRLCILLVMAWAFMSLLVRQYLHLTSGAELELRAKLSNMNSRPLQRVQADAQPRTFWTHIKPGKRMCQPPHEPSQGGDLVVFTVISERFMFEPSFSNFVYSARRMGYTTTPIRMEGTYDNNDHFDTEVFCPHLRTRARARPSPLTKRVGTSPLSLYRSG